MDGGGRGPGILSLRDLLEEYGGEILADLKRYYGINLRTAFDDGISPRDLLAFVENLPLESRTYSKRIANGDASSYGWDRNSYLLAEVIDVLLALQTTLVKVNSEKPKKVPDPAAYQRPGQAEVKKAKAINPFAEALRAGEDVTVSSTGDAQSFVIPSAVLARSQKASSGEGQPFTVN